MVASTFVVALFRSTMYEFATTESIAEAIAADSFVIAPFLSTTVSF